MTGLSSRNLYSSPPLPGSLETVWRLRWTDMAVCQTLNVITAVFFARQTTSAIREVAAWHRLVLALGARSQAALICTRHSRMVPVEALQCNRALQ